MSDVVIRAEGLGKKYLIGHQTRHERYTALRDVIGRAAKGFLRTASDTLRGRQLVAGDEVEEFWALTDVSFEVKRGEVVGIIGRNGAGKSTLLKVLSRITEPSAGRVEIRGRIASLLEVGTGFHPELTGRENIYLNGSVLGMTRAEIARKFDEMVAFAEVERFLDTPVKHYSSGMYTRLAFAVAAHLEPEILVVDEVLAVGDAEFQKKCLGKMQDVAEGEGRTVLFVSHNMTAVSQICSKGLVLAGGRAGFQGPAAEAIDFYANMGRQDHNGRRTTNGKYLRAVMLREIRKADNYPGYILTLEFEVTAAQEDIGLDLVIRSKHTHEGALFCSSAYFSDIRFGHSSGHITCELGPVNLAIGTYEIDAFVCRPMTSWLERHEGAITFEINQQRGARRGFELVNTNMIGSVIPQQRWAFQQSHAIDPSS
jgi:ABC-type polysaccharide/polyol phosphate transport system ATPase subunit